VLKKPIWFKPMGEGIQVFALAESGSSFQYLIHFKLDHNDKEQGKIQKTLLQLVGCLPSTNTHYQIAADNLFNS
jgi:hypothetical protein